MILKLPPACNDTFYDAYDLAKLLQLNCTRTVNAMVQQERIPPPDSRGVRGKGYWSHEYLKQFEGREFKTPRRYRK